MICYCYDEGQVHVFTFQSEAAVLTEDVLKIDSDRFVILERMFTLQGHKSFDNYYTAVPELFLKVRKL